MGILSGVYTEYCLDNLICAEADKVEYAVGYAEGDTENDHIARLAAHDNYFAGVLDKICYIESQVNSKIEQGRAIRGIFNNGPA